MIYVVAREIAPLQRIVWRTYSQEIQGKRLGVFLDVRMIGERSI
jgi:hypothetical protein